MSITTGKAPLENSNVGYKLYLGYQYNMHHYLYYHEHSEENNPKLEEENSKDKIHSIHHTHLPQGDLVVKWSAQLEKETLRAEILGTITKVQRCVEKLRALTFANDSWRGRECAADEELLNWLTKLATDNFVQKNL